MNTVVTSKEIILEASKKLIREEGLNSINIRSVASACGVSVGSIYNYFDSKSELVAATVESIWSEIFHNSGRPFVCCSFVEYIEWLFENLKEGYQKYPGFFAAAFDELFSGRKGKRSAADAKFLAVNPAKYAACSAKGCSGKTRCL